MRPPTCARTPSASIQMPTLRSCKRDLMRTPESGGTATCTTRASLRRCRTARHRWGTGGTPARQRRGPAPLPQLVLVEPVRQVTEGDPALRIRERDLAAGTVVTERAWGDGVAHAPKVRSAVFTCNYETSCAVGRRAEVVRQRVAHCAGRVGEHLGLPDAGGIMQERLVIEGEVGRSRHPTTARHANGAYFSLVERDQRFGRHFCHRQLGDADRRLELGCGQRLAGEDELIDVTLVAGRDAEL